MSINILPYSRFGVSEPIIVDNQETFGLLTRYSFLDASNLEDEEIGRFEVRPPFHERPDLISNQIYNVPSLHWVIILFNNPRQTLNWPPNGTVIRYPLPEVVYAEVL